jgi:hypothetical protein
MIWRQFLPTTPEREEALDRSVEGFPFHLGQR